MCDSVAATLHRVPSMCSVASKWRERGGEGSTEQRSETRAVMRCNGVVSYNDGVKGFLGLTAGADQVTRL